MHFDVIFAYPAKEDPKEATALAIRDRLLQEFFLKAPPANATKPVEQQANFEEKRNDLHYFSAGPSGWDGALWPPGIPNYLQDRLDRVRTYTYVIKYRPEDIARGPKDSAFCEIGVMRPTTSVNPSLSRFTHGRAD